MPRGTLSREPTAHVDDDLEYQANAAADLGREPTAHTDGDLTAHGPGDT